MLKKILAWLLVISTTATIAVGGTLAYLTDRDSEANVFTVGNVEIDLKEDFDNGAELIPGVDITKKPTITNVGPNDAWVWATVALPKNLASVIQFNGQDPAWGTWNGPADTTINNMDYVLYTALYPTALAKDDVTTALFATVALDKTVDIDPDGVWHTVVGGNATKLGWTNADGNPVVYVSAYAIQTDGFTDVNAAYNAYQSQWGDNGTEYPKPAKFVYNAEELTDALNTGTPAILGNDIVLESAVSVDEEADVDLNGYTLSTSGLELKAGGTIENGTIKSAVKTYLVPHLKVSGGTMVMDNVTVQVEHSLNANIYWTEASGLEIANANATLNDCDISVSNKESAQWVYSYAISLNNATITVNGGSITAQCVDGTAANGPTNPNAISSMGDCTATLINVQVTATYYGTTVNGHLTINTTDKSVTSANVVDNRGGSHTLNYID